MLIGGLQKTTLLDYPEKVACIVFTVGCNFRCGFCYNPDLIHGSNIELISEENFFDFLKKRKGILDGVVITGGEPLLQKDLKDFIIKIRQNDLLVKLDTNGTSPEDLKNLIDEKLVDYVAMDIKTTPPKYGEIVGNGFDAGVVEKSIKILLENRVDYEFRTTVVDGLHTQEDLVDVAKLINGAPKYYLQKFIASSNLLDKTFKDKESLSLQDLERIAEFAREYVKKVQIR